MSKILGLNVSLYISSLAQKAKAFKFPRHTHGCRGAREVIEVEVIDAEVIEAVVIEGGSYRGRRLLREEVIEGGGYRGRKLLREEFIEVEFIEGGSY